MPFVIKSATTAFEAYYTKANQAKEYPYNLQVWCKGKKRAHRFASEEEADKVRNILAVPATWVVVPINK